MSKECCPTEICHFVVSFPSYEQSYENSINWNIYKLVEANRNT